MDGGLLVLRRVTPHYEVTQHRTTPDVTPILRARTMRSVYECFKTVFIRMRKCPLDWLTTH